MSTMKFNRKPPLARSPIRQRPRRVLRSTATNTSSVQTPPGSLTKSQKLNNPMEESELRPEYRTISWELRTLAKMVNGEIENDGIGKGNGNSTGAGSSNSNSSPVFERGRFYEVYSERRNERLKRKIGGYYGEEQEAKTPYNLGVTADSSCKKKDSKKLGSLRKSMLSAAAVAAYSENTVPRYALRSMSKENKKPPLPVVSGYGRSVAAIGASEKKVGVRRARKI